jgi:hypothetical protein
MPTPLYQLIKPPPPAAQHLSLALYQSINQTSSVITLLHNSCLWHCINQSNLITLQHNSCLWHCINQSNLLTLLQNICLQHCINQSNLITLLHNSCLCAVSINQTSSSCCTTAVYTTATIYHSISPS